MSYDSKPSVMESILMAVALFASSTCVGLVAFSGSSAATPPDTTGSVSSFFSIFVSYIFRMGSWGVSGTLLSLEETFSAGRSGVIFYFVSTTSCFFYGSSIVNYGWSSYFLAESVLGDSNECSYSSFTAIIAQFLVD